MTPANHDLILFPTLTLIEILSFHFLCFYFLLQRPYDRLTRYEITLNLLVIFRTNTIRIGKFLRDTALRTASFSFYLSKVAFKIMMRHKYFTKSKISITSLCRRFKISASDSLTQDCFHREKRLSSIKLALSYCKDRKYDLMFMKKLEF